MDYFQLFVVWVPTTPSFFSNFTKVTTIDYILQLLKSFFTYKAHMLPRILQKRSRIFVVAYNGIRFR